MADPHPASPVPSTPPQSTSPVSSTPSRSFSPLLRAIHSTSPVHRSPHSWSPVLIEIYRLSSSPWKDPRASWRYLGTYNRYKISELPHGSDRFKFTGILVNLQQTHPLYCDDVFPRGYKMILRDENEEITASGLGHQNDQRRNQINSLTCRSISSLTT